MAHTNKHRSSDGKPIYGGTADVRDDCDCVFILDKLAGRLFEDEITVEFTCDKARGDVADSVCFTYARRHGQTYAELVNSVKRIDEHSVEELKLNSAISKKLEEDQDAIVKQSARRLHRVSLQNRRSLKMSETKLASAIKLSDVY